MTAKHGSGMLRSGDGSLFDGLARSVISKVNATPHQRRNRRIEIGSKILLAAVLDRRAFEQEALTGDLAALRITPTDIVDHCIPEVACALGDGWVENRLSFAEVSVASARLFGLCKSIGRAWSNPSPQLYHRDLLLVTVDREDHIIGPAVLADQLRRRGHSVQMHSNATGETICEKLRHELYDGVLISVSTTQALEKAAGVIKHTRMSFPSIPLVLGGAIVSRKDTRQVNTGADLVTNDIDDALDAMAGNDIDLRVAE